MRAIVYLDYIQISQLLRKTLFLFGTPSRVLTTRAVPFKKELAVSVETKVSTQ